MIEVVGQSPVVSASKPASAPVDVPREEQPPAKELTHQIALGVLVERHPDQMMMFSDVQTSTIDRLKRRNCTIAWVVGIVATIVLIAVYVLLMVIKVMKPAAHKAHKTKKLEDEMAHFDAVYFGTMGAIMMPLPLLPLFVGGINLALDQSKVEPLRRIARQLSIAGQAEHIVEDDTLIELMKRCDNKARKTLMESMSFEQLATVREVFGQKKFRHFINDLTAPQHESWKRIIDFSTWDESLEQMVVEQVETRRYIQQAINARPLAERPYLRSRLNELLKLDGAEASEKVTVDIGTTEIVLSKNWASAKSKTIRKVLKSLPYETLQDKIIPLNGADREQVLRCFRVMRDEEDLPQGIQELKKLAVAANYLRMDELVVRIGEKMLEHKASRHAFLMLFFTYVPSTGEECRSLRARAILLMGASKVKSLSEFKQLWPLAQKCDQLRAYCLRAFTGWAQEPGRKSSLQRTARGFRSQELLALVP